MKKLFSLFVLVFLLSCMICTSLAADFDLSGLSFDELVALKEQLNLAIWNSEEWQEVTVPQGVWVVGEDIPEGHWTISAADGASCGISWGTTLDESGDDIEDYIDYESIVSPSYRYYEANSDRTQIDYVLEAGQYIVISRGSAVFSPFSGKPSLGFK